MELLCTRFCVLKNLFLHLVFICMSNCLSNHFMLLSFCYVVVIKSGYFLLFWGCPELFPFLFSFWKLMECQKWQIQAAVDRHCIVYIFRLKCNRENRNTIILMSLEFPNVFIYCCLYVRLNDSLLSTEEILFPSGYSNWWQEVLQKGIKTCK